MNQEPNIVQALHAAASEVMSVESITEGPPPVQSIEFRGALLLPSHEAYDRAARSFGSLSYTPLLRHDGNGVALMAMPGRLPAAAQRPAVALLLFIATIVSCLFVGAQMPESAAASGRVNLNLWEGLPFGGSLLAILAAHELGHYFVGRRLGAAVSLPYFVPLPLPPFGTMGAFINMPAPPRNRRQLLAIGAAGPLSGLVLALPILWIGLSLSRVQPLPAGPYMMEGNSLLYAAMKALMFGRFLPSGGMDVFIHPVAFAGWAGLLVTGLNLIPAGQLDGGHVAYSLLGEKRANYLQWGVLAVLALLAFYWPGWLLWVALIFAFGRVRVSPLDGLTRLTRRQQLLAIGLLVLFVLVFTPIPLTQVAP